MLSSALSTDMMLLIILSSLTLIAYMIAINSHGAARMSLSYLLATILLAMTIFAVLQQVNSKVAAQQEQLYTEKVEQARADGANEIKKQQKVQKKAAVETEKQLLLPLIAQGSTLASKLKGVQLQGYGMSYDQLTTKATNTVSTVTAQKNKFKRVRSKTSQQKEATTLMNRAYDKLIKSARYYGLYYRSDDQEQEVVRERIVRSSAAEAETLFNRAKDALKSDN